jgi:diguanylate cyclase (GGDEF)-like protein
VDRSELLHIITNVRDRAIKKLEESNTPAYPKYYEQVFRDTLSTMQGDDIKNIFQRYVEHAPHEVEKDIEKYIELSQETFEVFANSNKEISKVVVGQGEYIDKLAQRGSVVDYEQIVTYMLGFQTKLLEEIKKSDEHIRKLEIELHSALQKSMIDRLTKLHNKRAYINDMSKMLISIEKKKTDTFILYLDIDNFRDINDKYGYEGGDKVLVFVSNTLKSYIGDEDKIYRIGDDDFAVIITHCEIQKANEIAERIRAKIETSKLVYKEEVIQLTVSIGITSHQASDDLIAVNTRGQKAVDSAKASGKNRVVAS